MPSTGAPSALPPMPGTSIFRPSSLMPCARSSIQSLRLSLSSPMPRISSSAMRDSSAASILSTMLPNHSALSSLALSSTGLPSRLIVMEPSSCSTRMTLP